ncbi:MAG: chemotaxis protein CheX [Desulfofustis sp.]|jgi:chemotaxis protein CheX|nr:chemotaxis protein CheX [Desulfofustis sp.]
MDYHKALQEGTLEIFQTMVFMAIEPLERAVRSDTDDDGPLVTGMIGLSGGIKGMLAVSATEEMAKAVTGAMLGMEVNELNDDVRDAFGEIANMVAGTLKSAGGDQYDMQLAIPTTTIGMALHVSGMRGAQRVQVCFENEFGLLRVELRFLAS